MAIEKLEDLEDYFGIAYSGYPVGYIITKTGIEKFNRLIDFCNKQEEVSKNRKCIGTQTRMGSDRCTD